MIKWFYPFSISQTSSISIFGGKNEIPIFKAPNLDGGAPFSC
jgi:hypothetical protein